MSVANFFHDRIASTTAAVRQTGAAISAALLAVGLTKTTDTGQADWTTVTAPAVITIAGYEVWKFTDSIGNDIFFRWELWRSSNVNHQLRFIVGNGSNGSGTITGNTYTTPFLGDAVNIATFPTSRGMASSDGTYVTLALGIYDFYKIVFSIGRTKDDSGGDTSDGVNILSFGRAANGTAGEQCYLPKNGGGLPVVLTAQKFLCSAPPVFTGSFGDRLGAFPVYVPRGASDNPCLGALIMFDADNGNSGGAGGGTGQLIRHEMYGVNHTWIYCGDLRITVNGNGNLCGMALRYE